MRSNPWVRDPGQRGHSTTPSSQPLNQTPARLGLSTALSQTPASASLLLGENLAHALDRIGFVRRLVRPQPYDPGKAQRVTALMALGSHQVVEGHFKHDLRLDDAQKTSVSNGVLHE